jgi:hypothetical protein
LRVVVVAFGLGVVVGVDVVDGVVAVEGGFGVG